MKSDYLIINKNKLVATIITIVVFSLILLFTFLYSFFSPKLTVNKTNEFEIAGFGIEKNQINEEGQASQKISKANTIDEYYPSKTQGEALPDEFKSMDTKEPIATTNNSNEEGISELDNKPGSNFSENEKGGFGINLTGRKILISPVLEKDATSEGKVVVEIVVDENGTVTKADPTGRGSTTNNLTLRERAKKAALATKFSPSSDYKEQKGTITIIFSF